MYYLMFKPRHRRENVSAIIDQMLEYEKRPNYLTELIKKKM